MMTRSDHMSMRVQIDLTRTTQTKKTVRSKRTTLNFDHLFNPQQASKTCTMVKNGMNKLRNMDTLTTTLDIMIKQLPRKTRTSSGWYDINSHIFAPLLTARNKANRAYALLKSEHTRQTYRIADKKLQQAMTQAENKWWITNLMPSSAKNGPQSSYQLWKAAQHALRGGDKWKKRNRAFVRDSNGKQATTIKQNVKNVCEYFSNVYNFASRPESLPHMVRIPTTPVERSYLSPRDFEIKKATSLEISFRYLKLQCVWKAGVGRFIRLAITFGWPLYSVGCFIRLAVLFSWPFDSIGHFIRLAILFCWTCYSIDRFIRLAVLFGWLFVSVDRSLWFSQVFIHEHTKI